MLSTMVGRGVQPAIEHREPLLVVAAGLVWLDARRLVVGRRSAAAPHGAGRLELPGGKLERGEAPAAALARELVEEWGDAARALRVGPIADALHHVYPPPGPEVLVLVYHVDASAVSVERLVPLHDAEILVFDRAALPLPEFLEADRAMVERVRSGALACPQRSPVTGAVPG